IMNCPWARTASMRRRISGSSAWNWAFRSTKGIPISSASWAADSVDKLICLAGRRTDRFARTAKRQTQALAMLAHPPHLPDGNADHQCVGRHISLNQRASAYEGIFSYRDAADDGAVGAEGRTALDERVAVFVLARNRRTRVVDVGEYHAGTAKHVVLESDIIVDGDIVLDFYVVADDDLAADVDILAERAAFADLCAGADVDPVPDTGVVADVVVIVDDGGGMNKNRHINSPVAGIFVFRPGLSDRWRSALPTTSTPVSYTP